MKFFSRKSFEHLLFALHPSTYGEIDHQLQELERRYPTSIAGLCTVFDLNFSNATTEGAIVPDSALIHGRPCFDIHVQVHTDRVSGAHKCEQVKVELVPQDAALGKQRGNSNHLVVSLVSGKTRQCFTVPLPLVLKSFEARVAKPGTFQVYQHTLIRQSSSVAVATPTTAPTFEVYMAGAGEYVGITSRTWQKRAMEHQSSAQRGSQLLFHRALRGERFVVHAHEHIVLRAGLTRAQALRVEEVEVEERTLHTLHPCGLNMIPGGEAGLRFLATMTKRPKESVQIDEIDDLLESVVNESLRQPGLNLKRTHTNPKLAALWQKDIGFRIRTMTGQARRMSYNQICSARILEASGWPIQKIHERLNGKDGREFSVSQLESLLSGKTYESIPHVMIPLAEPFSE